MFKDRTKNGAKSVDFSFTFPEDVSFDLKVIDKYG